MDNISDNSGKSKKKALTVLTFVGVILGLLAFETFHYYRTKPTSTGEPDYDIAYVINLSDHTVTITMPQGNSKKSFTIQPDDTCEIKKEVESFDIKEWLNSMDTVYLVFDGNFSIPYYRIGNNQYFPCEDNLLDNEGWIPNKVLVGTEQKFGWRRKTQKGTGESSFIWSEDKYRYHYIFVINNGNYYEAVDYNTNKKAR